VKPIQFTSKEYVEHLKGFQRQGGGFRGRVVRASLSSTKQRANRHVFYTLNNVEEFC